MSLGGVREAGWDPWEDTSSPDIEAAVRAAVVARDPDILGGEPVFAGTRTSVRHIGSLVARGLQDEVREDYPHLSDEDLALAEHFVLAANPEPPTVPGGFREGTDAQQEALRRHREKSSLADGISEGRHIGAGGTLQHGGGGMAQAFRAFVQAHAEPPTVPELGPLDAVEGRRCWCGALALAEADRDMHTASGCVRCCGCGRPSDPRGAPGSGRCSCCYLAPEDYL